MLDSMFLKAETTKKKKYIISLHYLTEYLQDISPWFSNANISVNITFFTLFNKIKCEGVNTFY